MLNQLIDISTNALMSFLLVSCFWRKNSSRSELAAASYMRWIHQNRSELLGLKTFDSTLFGVFFVEGL
jgi:hypothetical protein